MRIDDATDDAATDDAATDDDAERPTVDPTADQEAGPRTMEVGPFPWWMRGGHLETMGAAVLTLPLAPLRAERRLVEVEPGSCVETWWSAPGGVTGDAPARGSMLIVHGLGGSVQRPHVLATADEALRRGWHAVRVNLRNHGGTEALASTLFAASQSDDLGAVLAAMEDHGLPRPYVLSSASLGANMALRYAALEGSASRTDAVVALNPALDFFAVEREILRPSNAIYRLTFVRGLCRMLNAVRALRPIAGPPATLRHIRSIRAFDHHFTAPAAGFPDVDSYYAASGAGTVLDRLRVPALLLTAANDPIIPPRLVTPHHRAAGGRVQVAVTDRGGHVGYRVRDEAGHARFWAAAPALDWVERTLGVGSRGPTNDPTTR